MKTRRSKSKGGAEIIRYGRPTAKRDLALGNSKTVNAIDRHITKHAGKVSHVLHEILSDTVHIDIHVVAPTKRSPFWKLVTSGMSDLPMKAPKGCEKFRFAELAIALPGWWKLDSRSLNNQRWYWPIEWMKMIARFPHEYGAWLFYYHTMPIAPPKGARFSGVAFGTDSEFPDKFWSMRTGKKTIFFMTPIPIYQDEMDFALEHSSEDLYKHFEALGSGKGTDCYDPKRTNVLKALAKPRKQRRK